MSEHDYNLINQTGANLRADLNSVLLAIVSQNSSATEPATMFAYMFWADTSTGILKQRNAANSAWISLFTIATGAWLGNAATATLADAATTIAGTAGEKLPSLSVVQAAGALTFSSAAQYRDFRNATLTNGTDNTTIYAAPADTVLPSGGTLGFTTLIEGTILIAEMNNAGTKEHAICNKAGGLQTDESNLISTTAIGTGSDSANVWYSTTARTSLPYRIIGEANITNTAGAWGDATLIQPTGGLSLPCVPQMRLSVAQATTSGTSIDFTGIPTWANRVTLMLNGISSSGSSPNIVQLGAGSIETSGYTGGFTACGASSLLSFATGSTGFQIINGIAGGQIVSGHVVFTRVSGKIWIESFVLGDSAGVTWFGGGTKTLAGTLDRLRLTTVGGSDTFDAGSVNILYEG